MDPGHPQNSPRGLFAKQNIAIGEGGGLFLEDYSGRTAVLTASSTGLQTPGQMKLGGHAEAIMVGSVTAVQFSGGIKLNGNAKALINASGPGLTLSGSSIVCSGPGSAIPGNVDRGAAITMISNSTGVAWCLNTTGTTWRYIEVTGVQRTAGHG